MILLVFLFMIILFGFLVSIPLSFVLTKRRTKHILYAIDSGFDRDYVKNYLDRFRPFIKKRAILAAESYIYENVHE